MLEIKNVTFSYAGIKKSGIKNISLSVKQGECILLCGASGCGKNTLTRLINGLIPHFFKGELKGEVIVKDKKIEEQQLYNLAGLVGSVFQNPRSQFFSVDTDGEITFGAENIGLPKAEILKRKRAVVKELNLQSLMGRSLFDLSGGEKQKIACGSVAELLPEIIILDEPSSNLDRESILELREMMKLWKGKGKTLIISEHRLWYVKDVIDRAVFMEEGEIKGEWSRKEFNALSEEELISYELRPVSFEKVEEKFYFKENTVSTENKSFPGEIYLKDFYFTYNPKKYLFFSKKLTPEDEKICNIRIPKLKVKKGEIIGVIGRNGSGKSTFLRCLCGLEKSCIGSVIIDGVTYKGKGLTKLCYMVIIAKETEKIITANLSQRQTAAALSKRFGISETSLKNYFKNVYGTGFLEYQQKVRMEKAGKLLCESPDAVGSICEMVGYLTQAKFGAAFKDYFGMTPLEYRRRQYLKREGNGEEI